MTGRTPNSRCLVAALASLTLMGALGGCIVVHDHDQDQAQATTNDTIYRHGIYQGEDVYQGGDQHWYAYRNNVWVEVGDDSLNVTNIE